MDLPKIESPGLIVYPDLVEKNINYILGLVDNNPDRLRPHIKTHKTKEVNELLIQAGITKFKCATIAEAELLALSKANDILLSMQPTGTTLVRFGQLVNTYQAVTFSCLVDDFDAAISIHETFKSLGTILNIFIDLNVGMNRTGIVPEKAFDLIKKIALLENINLVGLHAYDGHIRDKSMDERIRHVEKDFVSFHELRKLLPANLEYVVGGTPSFLVHRANKEFVCSPGTFVFFDIGYASLYPKDEISLAVQLVSRIISKPTSSTICIDLGHKSVAAENTIENRVRFVNNPHWSLISQSEEHGIVEVGDSSQTKIGDIIFMYPYHICPSVALHQKLQVITHGELVGDWEVLARNRRINI